MNTKESDRDIFENLKISTKVKNNQTKISKMYIS